MFTKKKEEEEKKKKKNSFCYPNVPNDKFGSSTNCGRICLTYSIVKDLDCFFRTVCPFWAKNTAKILNILMAYYLDNAPSDSGNLTSGR